MVRSEEERNDVYVVVDYACWIEINFGTRTGCR